MWVGGLWDSFLLCFFPPVEPCCSFLPPVPEQLPLVMEVMTTTPPCRLSILHWYLPLQAGEDLVALGGAPTGALAPEAAKALLLDMLVFDVLAPFA